jgi:LAS superfamily LD-carboxypeptidase LdcB
MELAEFLRLFTVEERELIQKYLRMDPKSIGYKLPFIGTAENTNDLVPIKGQSFIDADKNEIAIPCQYLPRKVHQAYTRLNEAIHDDIGKKLLVHYGHRSVARQVFIFFDILERIYGFDVNKTIQRVCFPDYSEHVCTKRQAIDFKTEDKTISDDFGITEEYAWLQANAGRFGFYESYPKDNDLGMMYEPWHWRYEEARP